MNKWVKYSIAGLALSATQAFAEAPIETTEQVAQALEEVALDATDFFGGSKLKDRMLTVSNDQQIEMIQLMMS